MVVAAHLREAYQGQECIFQDGGRAGITKDDGISKCVQPAGSLCWSFHILSGLRVCIVRTV